VATSAVLFATVGGVNSAWAQKNAPAAAPVFGSVDLQKCAQESKARQASEDELRSFVQSLDRSLQRLAGSSSRFLSDAEIKELAALYEKEPASEGDKKRIQALEAKGDASSAELSRLQQVASPSDADKKKFTDLTTEQQKGDGILQSIRDTYSARVQTRRDDLSVKYTNQIRETVSKIAKDKGLTVVFDSQFALYTANDITPDVIKVLNK
jgi:Skp family chaperone for outer membrane proteins